VLLLTSAYIKSKTWSTKAVLLYKSWSPMPFLHKKVWHFDGRARFVTAHHEGIHR